MAKKTSKTSKPKRFEPWQYRITQAADPLPDDADVQIDEVDRVIWIAPKVAAAGRALALMVACGHAEKSFAK